MEVVNDESICEKLSKLRLNIHIIFLQTPKQFHCQGEGSQIFYSTEFTKNYGINLKREKAI